MSEKIAEELKAHMYKCYLLWFRTSPLNTLKSKAWKPNFPCF